MTDPRTTHHDDDPREHRGIGQRIMDAVLGDPADQRHDDPAGTRRDDPADTRQVDADRPGGGVGGGDQPRGEYASYEQAMRDHSSGGATLEDRGSVQDVDTRRDTAGYGYADDTRRDSGQAGLGDDARRDAGQAGYADDARRDAGQAGYDDRGEAARDAGYDARDTRTTGTTTGADRDFVTPSYDPDRDRGYDPQAAGTAVDDRAAAGTRADADRDFGAGRGDQDREYAPQASGALTDPAAGPVARNTPGPTHGDADYDTARDTGYVDDQRGGASRGYDPAQDTGYVDASRAEADRTTGRRDDDYDTGRVDTAGQDTTGRVSTERVDSDRSDTHRGAGVAAGAAGAGAVAAAAFGGGRGDSDRDTDRDTDRGASFSNVDDTATVDGTDTGRSTPDTGSGAQSGIAEENGESGGRERLVPADRADDYGSRWDALKGDFVDEPRRAVRQADELVGELLDELQRLFADQRHTLEQGFDHEGASTEDLRLALRRYRSFFDRLLSF
jgi:hypothetical protein